jgi:hypothetical protein
MMLHSVRCLCILELLEEELENRGSLPAKAGLTAETAVCWLAAVAAEEMPAC